MRDRLSPSLILSAGHLFCTRTKGRGQGAPRAHVWPQRDAGMQVDPARPSRARESSQVIAGADLRRSPIRANRAPSAPNVPLRLWHPVCSSRRAALPFSGRARCRRGGDMSKPLINLASWLFALLSAVAVLWRSSARAGFPALALGGRTVLLPAGSGRASRLPTPTLHACRGFHAAAAHVSAQGLWPRAEHFRGRVPRTCSTTAFGLFDATRQRGMGHPAG